LKKELEHANDLLEASKKRELSDEQLSRLCPTAAMTSKFIKSGLTLTQVNIYATDLTKHNLEILFIDIVFESASRFLVHQ